MKLNIIHTNDLHGHLESWPIIKQYLNLQKQFFIEKREPFLLVDIGDALDTVHPMVEATEGMIMVDLFNEAGYDVVTIGNNEGLNFTNNQLAYLYSQSRYEVALANLLDSRTYNYPKWASSIVYRDFEDLRIALIGLTAPYATYTLNQYELIDPYDALEQQLRSIQNSSRNVDVVIVLSHLGLKDDRLIAAKHPQIDLIIGGHTHHVLQDGEVVKQATIAAAGRYGEYVGLIELEIPDKQIGKLWRKTKRRIDINCHLATIEQLRDLTEIPISDSYELRGRQMLKSQKLAELPHLYTANRSEGENSFIQLALDAICDKTSTTLGVLSTGLFLSDLPKGIVTQNDLHEALPHSMHLIVMTFRGEHLIEMVEEMKSQEEDLRHRLINGMGFRGKIFGEIIFRGIEFNSKTQEWYAEGKAIVADRTYRVAAVDHYWFVPFFSTIATYGSPELLFPDFLRHVVSNYIQKKYPITTVGKD